MKNLILVFGLLLSVFFVSCSKENIVNPVNETTGSISLAFNKTTIPPNVAYVKLNLSRQEYEPIIRIMDLTSDSTAELNINQIAVGEWHLTVDAYSSSNVILYTGQTTVNIVENFITIVNLTLIPTNNGGLGSVKIYVKWGNGTSYTYSWIDNYGPIMDGGTQYQWRGVVRYSILYEDGIYKMWYAGLNNSAQANIFYATSIDGISWQQRLTPVLFPGFTWDSYSVCSPRVVKLGSEYRMYYRGEASTSGHWNIGLATSTDGITWEKRGEPILPGNNGDQYQVYANDVLVVNGIYYMYYVGRSNYGTKIFLATSEDGINFTRGIQPIIAPTYNWEGSNLFNPSVIYDNGKFKMVYLEYGCKYLGYAESNDGRTWVKNENPIYSALELKNDWSNRITNLNFRKIIDEYRIYVEGENNNSDYQMGLLKQIP